MTALPERMLFGTELRRRRTEAGLSLAGLASLVHYSKSHLSKVETGVKPPSTGLARRCDAALSCDGTLAGLAGGAPALPAPGQRHEPGEVWVLSLSADGDDRFRVVSRRELLLAGGAAGGTAGLMGWAGGLPAGAGPDTLPDALASFRINFDQLRRLGQHLGAPVLLPLVVTQAHALRRLAAGARPAGRDAALRLAARFAEYAGWMAQETGDDDRAMWWTERAVELAGAGGDREMAAYALVRRGLVTLYRHDPLRTVALASQAQAAARDTRIRGLGAQREAQGHALAGDTAACLAAIDRAAALLSRAGPGADPADGGPTIGTSHVTDPAALAKGWCLYDLGRPAAAIDVLVPELARIPVHAGRARARCGARLARAYADSGEIEQACRVVEPVLATQEQICSATIRADLQGLSRTLNRWHRHRAIHDTRLRLVAALRTGA